MKTRDQEYASDIVKRVIDVRDTLHDIERNRYGSLAHQLPILVRSAGLAQALAFLETRDSRGPQQLLNDLAATIGEKDIVQRAQTATLDEYIYLTRQIMAALLWYKRFSQSILDIQAETGKETQLTTVPDAQADTLGGREK